MHRMTTILVPGSTHEDEHPGEVFRVVLSKMPDKLEGPAIEHHCLVRHGVLAGGHHGQNATAKSPSHRQSPPPDPLENVARGAQRITFVGGRWVDRAVFVEPRDQRIPSRYWVRVVATRV